MATVGFIRRVLLAAGSTSGTSVPVDCRSLGPITVWVRGTGTISTGVVTVEQADYDPQTEAAPYSAGAWASITTIDATALSGGSNGQSATMLPAIAANAQACWGFVRVRLSTTVTGGGSVQVTLTGRPDA